MRLFVVLLVFIQLKEYEQSSYPGSYQRRQDADMPSYFGSMPQHQYGSGHQMDSYNKYRNPQQSSVATLPQEALTRTTVYNIPPSQAEKPVNIPQNVDGYQLVHSGFPPGSDNSQGQQNTQQIPQNRFQDNTQQLPQGTYQFASHNPASYQNDYQMSPNYYGKPSTTNISPPPVQSDNHQLLFPYNFQGQDQYQTNSENTNRLPRHFPTELPSIPPQTINPYGAVNPTADFNTKVNNVPQSMLQYFQQNIPQQSSLPSAPQYGQQHQYTVNQISQDILPYLSQLNLPQSGQFLPNQQNAPQNGQYFSNQLSASQNGQFLSNQQNLPQTGQYISNSFLSYGAQQNGKQIEDFQGATLTVPGQGNYFNDAFLQLSKQQPQRASQINKEGYQVVNEVTTSQQSQLKNTQINNEGYQVVNEAPVTHYVSQGQPNTKIITLEQQSQISATPAQTNQNPIRSQSTKIFSYNDQAIEKETIPIQTKQQPSSNLAPNQQQPEVSDRSEPQSKESQKVMKVDSNCKADNRDTDTCACDLCSKMREN